MQNILCSAAGRDVLWRLEVGRAHHAEHTVFCRRAWRTVETRSRAGSPCRTYCVLPQGVTYCGDSKSGGLTMQNILCSAAGRDVLWRLEVGRAHHAEHTVFCRRAWRTVETQSRAGSPCRTYCVLPQGVTYCGDSKSGGLTMQNILCSAAGRDVLWRLKVGRAHHAEHAVFCRRAWRTVETRSRAGSPCRTYCVLPQGVTYCGDSKSGGLTMQNIPCSAAGRDVLWRLEVGRAHHAERAVAWGGGEFCRPAVRAAARLRSGRRTRALKLHAARTHQGNREHATTDVIQTNSDAAIWLCKCNLNKNQYKIIIFVIYYCVILLYLCILLYKNIIALILCQKTLIKWRRSRIYNYICLIIIITCIICNNMYISVLHFLVNVADFHYK